MNIEHIIIVVVSVLHPMFNRFTEFTYFDTWRDTWVKDLLKLEEGSFWYKWWMSKDEDELLQWYLWHFRDAYHTFKNLIVFILYGALCYYNLRWLIALPVWVIVQMRMEYLLKIYKKT